MTHFAGKRLTLQTVIASTCVVLVIGYCARHTSGLSIVLQFSVLQVGMLLVLLAAANTIGAIRLLVVHKWLGLTSISPTAWMRLFVASRFANFYLTQGANLYRAVQLKRGYSFSYSQSVSITGAIMLFDVAGVLLLTALILMTQRSSSWVGPIMLVAVVAIVSPAILLPRLLRRTRSLHALQNHRWSVWLGDTLNMLMDVLNSCTRELHAITFIGGMTVLAYLTHLLGTYVCLAAFGQGVSLFDAAVLTSAVILSRVVNIVPGNIGVSELITGASAGVLMDEMMYGVMVAAVFRAVDYAVIGSAFLLFRLECLVKEYRAANG
jgi:hypothetical protein